MSDHFKIEPQRPDSYERCIGRTQGRLVAKINAVQNPMWTPVSGGDLAHFETLLEKSRAARNAGDLEGSWAYLLEANGFAQYHAGIAEGTFLQQTTTLTKHMKDAGKNGAETRKRLDREAIDAVVKVILETPDPAWKDADDLKLAIKRAAKGGRLSASDATAKRVLKEPEMVAIAAKLKS